MGMLSLRVELGMGCSRIPDGVADTPDHPDAARWHALNAAVVDEFRANAGRVGGFLDGQDLVLLTTTGAKTGRPRMVVLALFTINGQMIVVGSKGGAPKHPDWVLNLRINPRAHAEIATTSFDVTARELSDAENDETYRRVIELQPRFGVYRNRTTRRIALFELQPM